MDCGNGLGRALVADDRPCLSLRRSGCYRRLDYLPVSAADVAHGEELDLAVRLPETHPAGALAGLDSGTLIAEPRRPHRAGSSAPFG